jgi:protoheme IX farnesyltransferase
VNARAVSVSTTASDLLSLTKPRLSSLVVCTTAGGLWLAPGPFSPAKALVVLLATSGLVGAANALNCYIERDTDRLMARTRNRPLPARRMEPQVALGFGIALAALSLPALALGANLLTAALGLVAFLTYVLVYTPLKPRSHWAMAAGAVAGALPALMGWTAATGEATGPGWVLFAILFVWQMPHFIAIALFRKDEYEAAGLKSLPLVRGDAASRAQILGYLVVLLPVTLLPAAFGLAGGSYLAVAALLGAGFVGLGAWGFLRRLGASWARQLFVASLLHLTGIYLAMMLAVVAR